MIAAFGYRLRLGRHHAARAIAQYDVNVVGLTLSKNQAALCAKSFGRDGHPARQRECCWRDGSSHRSSTASVDRARSIPRHDRRRTSSPGPGKILPPDGVLLLHTITGLTRQQMVDHGFAAHVVAGPAFKFIATEIFPGRGPDD